MGIDTLLTPEGNPPPSRRAALASMFVAGYAPAALSACATPITTEAEGILMEDVTFPGHGGYQLPAYVARPNNKRAGYPAVIVANEIFGIHAYIKDVCHRLANAGYVAIAPDYFDRAGDPATLTDFAQIMPIVAAAGFEQVMGDTQGAVNWLKDQSFANERAIGITGFCWGGNVVWMAASRVPEINAGVAWYGRLVKPADSQEQRPYPIDIAPTLTKPVLGLYGENDGGIPLSSVEAMRAALASNGNPSHSEIVVYPGAQHGFHADYRPSYNAEAAADGWTRLLAWFAAHGVA
jgi:carboxymethylenebutenolidase